LGRHHLKRVFSVEAWIGRLDSFQVVFTRELIYVTNRIVVEGVVIRPIEFLEGFMRVAMTHFKKSRRK
jgi:hypothetical protein